MQIHHEENNENKNDSQKTFDIKVSFLVIRDNERVDLIIEYFNEKLKRLNNQQTQNNQDTGLESNVVGNKIHGGLGVPDTNLDDSNDGGPGNNGFKHPGKDVEKEFVFNFRTFKEVFPYISSVSVADHSSIEEAYKQCIKRYLSHHKKKLSFLSNIVVIQFHKTTFENSPTKADNIFKQKSWSNFFTYIHIPFNDKNVNPDIATMSEIIGRAMEKKSETKVFDCLFRKSPLLMRLQDFLFPAYPSQKDFLATQTKLQVTLSPFSDLKRLSTFFTQLQFFKSRYKNEIINEGKAASLLSKYFEEDFNKIKGILKDFSISKQLLNLKQSKKYATPGTDDLSANVYSYLINFLSYGYKNPIAPSSAPHGYNSTLTIEGPKSEGYPLQRYRESPNVSNGNYTTNYGFRQEDKRTLNKRSVASVGYNLQRNPIASLKNAGRIDIEKRIHLDNLK